MKRPVPEKALNISGGVSRPMSGYIGPQSELDAYLKLGTPKGGSSVEKPEQPDRGRVTTRQRTKHDDDDPDQG